MAQIGGLLVVLILSTFVWMTPVQAQAPATNFSNVITNSVNQIGSWFNDLSQDIKNIFAPKPATVYIPYPVFQYQPATGTPGKIVVNSNIVNKKTTTVKAQTSGSNTASVTQPSNFITNNYFSTNNVGLNSYGDNILGGTLSFASGTIIDFSNTHVFNWPHTYGGGGSITNVTNNYTSAETDPWFMLASSSLSYLKVEADPLWSLASTTLTVANFATSSISQWTNDAGYLTSATLGESDPYWSAVSTTVPYLASQNTFTATNTIANLIVSNNITMGSSAGILNWTAGTGVLRSLNSMVFQMNIGDTAGRQFSWYTGSDNTSIMTLLNNGNLGIGTSTPRSRLVLDGNSSTISGLEISNLGTATRGIDLSNSGLSGSGDFPLYLGANTYFRADDFLKVGNIYSSVMSAQSLTATVSNLALNSWANGNIILTPNGSGNTIIANGNVGIGTTTPNYKLVVRNASSTVNFIEGSSGVSAYPIIQLDNNASGIGNGGALRFSKNGTNLVGIGSDLVNDGSRNFWVYDYVLNQTRLLVDANGNLGIGTATPTSRIHGSTTLAASTGNEVAYELDYNANKSVSGNDTGLLINQIDTASPGTSNILDLQRNGISRFRVNNGGDLTMAGGIYANSFMPTNVSVNWIAQLRDPNYQFQFLDVSSSPKLVINNNGNVGIGTANPNEILEVNGNIQANSYKISGATILSGNSSVALGSAGATGNVSLKTVAGTGLYVTKSSDSSYNLVGVNTTSPTAIFTIQATSTVAALNIVSSTGASMFTVLANGNVGIGTSSPVLPLAVIQGTNGQYDGVTVYSNALAPQRYGVGFGLDSTSVGGNWWRFWSSGSADSFGADTFQIIDQTQLRARMVINSSGGIGFGGNMINNLFSGANMVITGAGSVGIGTTSPSQLLHVYKAGAIARLLVESTSNSAGLILQSAGTNGGVYYNRLTTNGLEFDANGATKMVIDGNGYIGIGTSTPNNTLTVNGDIGLLSSATTTVTSNGKALVLQQTGDAFGTSRLTILNRQGYGGAMFEGTNDLVDFIFKSSAGGSQNIRFEHRSDYVLTGNTSGEFEIGSPGMKGVLAVGDATSVLRQGNFGVGTTTPGGKLHVYQGDAGGYSVNANANGLVLEDDISNGMTIATPDGSTSNIFFGSPARQIGAKLSWRYTDNMFTLGTGNGGAQVSILSGNSVEAIRIDGSGNVGIGSSTPYAKLAIEGASDETQLLVKGYSTQNNSIVKVISSGGTNLFYVNSDGNVGVPNGELVIQGATGTLKAGQILSAGNPNPFSISTYNGSAYISRLSIAAVSGYVSIGTSTGPSRLTVYNTAVAPQAFFYGSSPDGANINNGWIRLGNYANIYYRDAGATAMNFDSNYDSSGSVMYFRMRADGTPVNALTLRGTGYVGIGTTTPDAMLNIFGATSTLLRVSTSTNQNIFVIDNNGDVGIGTSSPSNSLTVVSSISSLAGMLITGGSSVGTASLNSGQILLGSQSGAQARISYSYGDSTLYLDNTYDNDAANIIVRSHTYGTPRNILTMLGSGNIGIGTSTPSAKLQVTGTAGSGDVLTVSSSTNSSMFTVLANGNVGIGTSTMNAQLGIVSNSNTKTALTIQALPGQLGNSRPLLTITSSTGAVRIKMWVDDYDVGYLESYYLSATGRIFTKNFSHPSGAAYAAIGMNDNKTIDFWSNNTARMIIDSSGNIGIGTTTPSSTLTVQGTSSTPLLSIMTSTTASALYVATNGSVGIGNSNPSRALYVTGSIGSSVDIFSGRDVVAAGYILGTYFSTNAIVSKDSYNLGTPHFITIGDNNWTSTDGNQSSVLINPWMHPASGTSTFAGLLITPTVNQTGGANGITRGLYINPTLTSAADFRSIEVASGNSIFLGNVGIGTSTPVSTLTVQGFSSASALNIVSSTGDSMFTVLANGNVGIGTSLPGYKLDVHGTTATDFINTDIGLNFNPVARPTSFTTALAGAGAGNVNVGDHYYFVTYITALGETELATNNGGTAIGGGMSTLVTTTAGDGKVNITVTASTDYRVTGINIYRTPANGAYYADARKVASLSNVSQTYLDNTTDAARTGSDYISKENTTNKSITVNNSSALTLGIATVGLGRGALVGQTTGSSNTVIGAGAGASVSSGSSNVLLGYQVGGGGANPSTSIGIGQWSLYQSTGGRNIAIGHDSLFSLTGGSGNLAIGSYSGFANVGSNSIFLGSSAGRYETSSNKLIIDSIDRSTATSSRDSALIYGIFDSVSANQILALGGGGKVGIGTTSPTSLLHLGTSASVDAAIGFTSQAYNWTMGIDNSDSGRFVLSNSSALGTSNIFQIDTSGNIFGGNFYGSSVVAVGASWGVRIRSNSGISWSGSTLYNGTADLGLARFATSTLQVTDTLGGMGNLVANNIGIGTTTLSSTLTVQGTSSIPAFTVASSTGDSMFTIAANGNVGIGTTNTNYPLTVMGAISLNGNYNISYGAAPGFTPATGLTIASNISNGRLTIGDAGEVNFLGSQAFFGYADRSYPTSTAKTGGFYKIGGVQNIWTNVLSRNIMSLADNGDVVIGVNAYQTYNSNNISSNMPSKFSVMGNSYFNGSVGIGTTTPLATLTVQATSSAVALNVASSTGVSMFTIAANGNVGIGVTPGTAKFDVNGESWLARNPANSANGYMRVFNDGAVHLSPSGGATALYIDGWNDITLGASAIVIAGLLSPSGNIGMSANTYATVGTPLSTSASLIFNTWAWNGADGYHIQSQSNIKATQLDYTNTHARIDVAPGGVNVMSLLYNGLVGIGTSTPNANLNIFGTTSTILRVATSTNQNIFVINSNGNVGIGNNAPSAGLEVGSNSNGLNAKISATLGAELAPALTTGNWTLGGNWQYLTSPDSLNKYSDGQTTAVMSTGGSIVAGTTYKVTITVSSVTGSISYTLGGTGGTLLTTATTYTDYITAVNTNKLNFQPANNTSRIVITAVSITALADSTGDFMVEGNFRANSPAYFMGGNVGIGTTNPSAPFHTVVQSVNTVSWYLESENTSNHGGTRVYVENDGAGGDFTFGGAISAFDGTNNPIRLTSDHAGRVSNIYRASGDGQMFGTAVAGTSKDINWVMTINSRGNTGFVGIGTTTPAGKLEVLTGATSTRGLIIRGITGGASNLFELYTTATGVDPAVSINQNGSMYTQGIYAYNGIVSGVGNHLLGAWTGYDTNATLSIMPVTAAKKGLALIAKPGQTGNLMEWQDSSSTVLGVINSSGYLGIGTTTFASTLTVQATSGISALSIASSSGESLLYIAPNGNIGIGKTNPSTSLEIGSGTLHGISVGVTYPSWMGDNGIYAKGQIRADGGYMIESNYSLAWGNSMTKISGYAQAGDYYLKFITNNVDRMRIDVNGLVGIGTTTPNANLNIFGATTTLLRVATSTNQNIFVIGADGNATFGGSITASSLMGGATNLTVDANGVIVRDPSDINLKENVTPLAGALDKVLALQGVSFNWKDKTRFGTQEEIGFVAQQVQGVVPQLVSTGGSYLSLKYPNVTALLVEAFKQQYKLVSTDTLAMFGTTTATTTSYWMNTSTLANTTSTETVNLIASSTAVDLIVSRLTQGFSIIREFFAEKVIAAIGVFDQLKTRWLETDTARINNGMEIKDAATGEIYCIKIVNGDWSKTKGACNVAGAYEAVTPASTVPQQTVVEPQVSSQATTETTTTIEEQIVPETTMETVTTETAPTE